jgi:hypothetical protein
MDEFPLLADPQKLSYRGLQRRRGLKTDIREIVGALNFRLFQHNRRKAGIELYSNATQASAVKGRCPFFQWCLRKEYSYASFKACAISAIRSDGCSMPIESRIVESRTPIFCRMSAGTPEWVMLAGKLARDSVPPRLTAS